MKNLVVLRRASHILQFTARPDDTEHINSIITAMREEGMPQPSTKILALVFGRAFAARCAVEIIEPPIPL